MAIDRWHRKSSKALSENRIFSLRESTTESPETGAEHLFYYIETADWVNVVPMTTNNELVCIKQFRHGNETITLEIPGGMVDPGEEPIVSAARECLEETGYRCEQVEPLAVLAPNPALFDNQVHTFVARNVELTREIANSATEKTEVVLVPFADIPALLDSGEIDHALVVATLWRFLYQELATT
jgi:8-oxo-dGTP pyrophosphatase MutT (NUDIX family)